jgi:hypothetical protein
MAVLGWWLWWSASIVKILGHEWLGVITSFTKIGKIKINLHLFHLYP